MCSQVLSVSEKPTALGVRGLEWGALEGERVCGTRIESKSMRKPSNVHLGAPVSILVRLLEGKWFHAGFLFTMFPHGVVILRGCR